MAATTKCIKKKNAPSPVSASQKLKFEFFNVFIGNLFLIKNQRNPNGALRQFGGKFGAFCSIFLAQKLRFYFWFAPLKNPLRAFVLFFIFSPFSFSFLHIQSLRLVFVAWNFCFLISKDAFISDPLKKECAPPRTHMIFIHLLFLFIILFYYNYLLFFYYSCLMEPAVVHIN